MMEWREFDPKKPDKNIPDVIAGQYLIKLKNGSVHKATFYHDQMRHLAFYGIKVGYWWDSEGTPTPYKDVIAWKEIQKNK